MKNKIGYRTQQTYNRNYISNGRLVDEFQAAYRAGKEIATKNRNKLALYVLVALAVVAAVAHLSPAETTQPGINGTVIESADFEQYRTSPYTNDQRDGMWDEASLVAIETNNLAVLTEFAGDFDKMANNINNTIEGIK